MDWKARTSNYPGCWSCRTPLKTFERMFMAEELKPVLVDLDGTLLDATIDLQFNSITKEHGKAFAEAWYARQDLSMQRVNWELVEKLVSMHKKGHKLYVWTNRDDEKLGQTKACLKNNGLYDLFQAFIFCGGKKMESVDSGITKDTIIFDNEEQYGTNCAQFNHIPTFM